MERLMVSARLQTVCIPIFQFSDDNTEFAPASARYRMACPCTSSTLHHALQ